MELLYDEIILDIINSDSFKKNLVKINNNYNLNCIILRYASNTNASERL